MVHIHLSFNPHILSKIIFDAHNYLNNSQRNQLVLRWSTSEMLDLHKNPSRGYDWRKPIVTDMKSPAVIASNFKGARVDVQSLLRHLLIDQLKNHAGGALLKESANIDCLVDENKVGDSVGYSGRGADLEKRGKLYRRRF